MNARVAKLWCSLLFKYILTRVVSIAIVPDSGTIGDAIKCSANKSPFFLFDYREQYTSISLLVIAIAIKAENFSPFHSIKSRLKNFEVYISPNFFKYLGPSETPWNSLYQWLKCQLSAEFKRKPTVFFSCCGNSRINLKANIKVNYVLFDIYLSLLLI
jgi:hypothetical protein